VTTLLAPVTGLLDRLRARLAPAPQSQRFLDRPYASVQLLVLAALGLLGFGVLMAVSTTIAASNDVNGTSSASIWTQVVKEGEFVLFGVPVFWFAVRLPPRAFRLLAYPAMVLALVGLLAVLVPGVGVSINGARRWIDIGPLQLQPSEFAKVAVLLWGADLLARKQQFGTLRRARHLFLPLLPGFALVAALVMTEPDLGTTCCFILILLGGWVSAMAVLEPYRLERITSYLHPLRDTGASGYQAIEGLYALASGGFFGVGLGQGTSKYGWVPNASTDYVFAIIGEELGLIGCFAVLALFGLLAYTGMRIARRNADPFVRLVAGAATVWLCGQAVINVGYVTGLLPVTGIPLPLISAGGTSLLASFFVLSCSSPSPGTRRRLWPRPAARSGAAREPAWSGGAGSRYPRPTRRPSAGQLGRQYGSRRHRECRLRRAHLLRRAYRRRCEPQPGPPARPAPQHPLPASPTRTRCGPPVPMGCPGGSGEHHRLRAPRRGRRRSFGWAHRAGDELRRRPAQARAQRGDHRAGYRTRTGYDAHPGPRLSARTDPARATAAPGEPGAACHAGTARCLGGRRR
jgi:cell division protein FtsW